MPRHIITKSLHNCYIPKLFIQQLQLIPKETLGFQVILSIAHHRTRIF